MDDYCPGCDQEAPAHVELRTETYSPGGVAVTLHQVPVRVCDNCGSERCDPLLDDATLVRAYRAAGLVPCAGCGRYRRPQAPEEGRCHHCRGRTSPS